MKWFILTPPNHFSLLGYSCNICWINKQAHVLQYQKMLKPINASINMYKQRKMKIVFLRKENVEKATSEFHYKLGFNFRGIDN